MNDTKQTRKTHQAEPLRDTKGHYVSQKKRIKGLAKAAKAELKATKEVVTMKNAKPGLGQAIQAIQPPVQIPKPKPVPIEEQVKILQTEINVIKNSMNKHQQDVINHALETNQAVSNLRENLSQHTTLMNKNYQNLSYLDTVSRTPENTQDAFEDKKTFDWMRKLRAKFSGSLSDTSYPYPLTKEEVSAEAKRWTRKLLGMNATWICYGACAIASLANGNVAIWVLPFGLVISVLISAAIWKE